jgi:hypothetical protein
VVLLGDRRKFCRDTIPSTCSLGNELATFNQAAEKFYLFTDIEIHLILEHETVQPPVALKSTEPGIFLGIEGPSV